MFSGFNAFTFHFQIYPNSIQKTNFAPMVKLFLSNRAIVQALLPILIAGYFVLGFYFGSIENTKTINLGVLGVIKTNFYLSVTINLLLIFVNAFLLNFLFNKNGFYERNMYVSSLIYVVLMSFFESFYGLNGLVIAHTFFILAIYQLFKLQQNEDGRKHIFNAAFFAGVATIVHPPLIIIFPFLYFMVWTIRPFVWRESLLLGIGFSIPIIYGTVIYYLGGQLINLKLIRQPIIAEIGTLNFYVSLSSLVILIALSFAGISVKNKKISIRLKKLTRLIWFFVIIATILGAYDIFFFGQIERFSFFLIPISFFLPFAFTSKTWGGITEFLFYLAIIYSVIKFFI